MEARFASHMPSYFIVDDFVDFSILTWHWECLDHEGGFPEQRPSIALRLVDVRHIRKQRLLGKPLRTHHPLPTMTFAKRTNDDPNEIGAPSIPNDCHRKIPDQMPPRKHPDPAVT
ncbi:hypothetical protein TNIN_484451 [Trichonephila inaurata madagascariensis]|uniref:Uncharacterized protein n=1 Tax=Trichonephila inaurata madagascariensis TaxID=2747483 RepID=A0A8X6XT37_9ARAC|nr:hypothetical protein TNIN_484451 [Trichonephila inaurata madagascariensis]